MNIIKTVTYNRKRNLKITFSVCFVFFALVVIISAFMYFTIEKSVTARVRDESRFLVEQQAEFINETIDEQYNLVSCIASMVENGLSFSNQEGWLVLKTLVEKNELCMLAYADESGDVMNYQGEIFGNVSDRKYFSDVISGKNKFYTQYLPTAGEDNTPRIIFSTAVRRSGKITGVVFISKEVDVLCKSLFGQSMFDGKDNSVVVDRNGNILAQNNQAKKKYNKATNITDIISDRVWKKNCSEKKSGVVFSDKGKLVVASAPIHQNNWTLICLLDMNSARQKYSDNMIAIRHLVMFSWGCFFVAGTYFVGLAILQWRKSKNSYEISRTQYNRVIKLLEKMKCMIFDYNLETGTIQSNNLLEQYFEIKVNDNLLDWIEQRRKEHREFDFDGLIREARYAIQNKQPVSMGSIYKVDDSAYKMYSVIMLPIMDSNGQVTNILGCVKESSDEHHQLKEEVALFHQIPGGIYRTSLDHPIYVDYVSDRLCKMLGYSQDEFNGPTGRYYKNCVLDEDREKYLKFVQESTIEPGVRKCEYRLCDKNGAVRPVLETRETIRNDSGRMYGYSVVVDVTEYENRQQLALQEIRQLEERLVAMRIQNSTTQMQPHFLYNALSSIREVVLLDPEYASDLIYDFTTFLRACIRTMNDGALISIHQEMKNIHAYVNIEKMRMGNRLNVVYDLKSDDFKIPPLSIQPLVENAIRHGIFKRGKQGGTVWISSDSFSQYHVITVKDNGVGFDYKKLRDEIDEGLRDSIGLDNIIFRLKKQVNGEVVIRSHVGEGTVITIRIPRAKDQKGTE